MAPTTSVDSLNTLDQEKLGDNKLSIDERKYLETKDQLLYKDIGEKLLQDIRAVNFALLEDHGPSFLDAYISEPAKMQAYLKKEDGLEIYTSALESMSNVNQKRAVVLNFLLSSFTTDFQKSYDLTHGFNFDTINLIFHFQQEQKTKTDCIFGPGGMKLLKSLVHQGEKELSKYEKKKEKILTTKDNQSIEYIERTPFTECAEYVIDSMMDIFDRSKKSIFTTLTGIVGNARTMYDNIKTKLGKSIYSAFSEEKIPEDVDKSNPESIKKYVEKMCATSGSSLDVTKFQKGDVVGLYYPKSSNHVKAAQGCESGTCNTHVGYVRDIMADGTPIVSHNVHGVVYNQPANELINTKNASSCMITWGMRPNLNRI